MTELNCCGVVHLGQPLFTTTIADGATRQAQAAFFDRERSFPK